MLSRKMCMQYVSYHTLEPCSDMSGGSSNVQLDLAMARGCHAETVGIEREVVNTVKDAMILSCRQQNREGGSCSHRV